MNITTISFLFLSLWVGATIAQEGTPPEPPGGHRGPPPQAYADCRGKQPGEAVQHMTPEGQVAATCQNSPEGLVARPNNRPFRSPSVPAPNY